MKIKRKKLAVDAVLLLVFSCAAPRPTVNAPDFGGRDITLIGIREVSGQPGGDYLESSSPLARNLFMSAAELDNELHQRPIEARTKGDYLRVIDSYMMVNRVGTDERLAGESLWRSANTMREIADTMGDYTLYRKAIRTFHQIIDEHPRSNYVGEALLGIAQICEENLQDLKGAAEAYRAIIGYFPNSVLARESKAILSRFQSELLERNGQPDVILPDAENELTDESTAAAHQGVTLENLRNYTGPDYSRIVLDLSDEAVLNRKSVQNNQVSLELGGVRVSPALHGRRFIIRDSRFLKQITVRGGDSSDGIGIELLAGAPVEMTAFQLSSPARIVIDLHSVEARAVQPSQDVHVPHASEANVSRGVQAASKASSIGNDSRLQERSLGIARATLPEVDVSNLSSLQESLKGGANGATKGSQSSAQGAQAEEAKAASDRTGAVRCIVIDPGHGGHDTGTIGAGGLKEKDLVLAVATRLREYIRKNFPDIEVVMTRDSDRFIALEERTAIANSKRADLFISIHANAAPSHSASGVETYFLSPGRAASETVRIAEPEQAPATEARATPDKQLKPASDKQSKLAADRPEVTEAMTTVQDDKLKTAAAAVSPAKVSESRELAGYIQSGLVRGVGSMAPKTAMNRGVKNAGFVVLLGAAMPSVLAEISFVSNPHDEDLLRTDQFRDRIAVSLFAGLRAYLKKKETAEAVKNKKKL